MRVSHRCSTFGIILEQGNGVEGVGVSDEIQTRSIFMQLHGLAFIAGLGLRDSNEVGFKLPSLHHYWTLPRT